jgi:hypothetical protein
MDSPAPVKKAVNQVKATLEKRRGPVEKDQARAPIADAVAAYWERDTLTFGIPAHNGGRGPLPEVAKWAGLDAVRNDVSMSHGVDTRDRPGRCSPPRRSCSPRPSARSRCCSRPTAPR